MNTESATAPSVANTSSLAQDHSSIDDPGPVDVSSPCQEIKRPKLYHDGLVEVGTESYTLSDYIPRPKKMHFNQYRQFRSPGVSELSPITEISVNLSDATLNTPLGAASTNNDRENGDTPLRGWKSARTVCRKVVTSKNFTISKKKIIQSTLTLEDEADDDILPDRNMEKLPEITRYQMPLSSGSMRSNRRLNMDGSSSEMAVDDELLFYDDEQASFPSECSFGASPQLLGLLSPEGPARRFQIVERPASKKPSPAIQKKQPSATSSSTISLNASPKGFRVFQSLSSESMESSMDDEYMELFEMESLEQQTSMFNFPSDLNSLIRGQIKQASPVIGSSTPSQMPDMRRPSVRRCLSMNENHQQNSPKTPEFLKQVQESDISITPFSSRLLSRERNKNTGILQMTTCFKRPEPPSTSGSPVQSKRYRGDEKENLRNVCITPSPVQSHILGISSGMPLRKCMSMNDAEIMSALARSDNTDEPHLIGDFTKPFVLPLMEGRHRDLKSVSSDTVARLIKGEFVSSVANYCIIDCRYPYEYEGGHIRGAKNFYTQEQIVEEFLTKQKTDQQQLSTEATDKKRNIIIFHCEFSSERGPKLSRFLRNNDRARNTNSYPALDYPEIYLLHNGYKEFYETHAELCVPVAYRPMLEPSYSEAYRHFRAKSKSWNGDGLVTGGTSRIKKTRSRLML